MGYSDVGVYGQKRIKTPEIDQLAAEGMKFTDFYAGAAVCSPSRSVLMTGLHTGHTTIRGNTTFSGGDPGTKGKAIVYRTKLTDDTYTVGKMMQEAGYKTGLVGKWHLGGYDISATPLQRGFDEFVGWTLGMTFSRSGGRWPDMIYTNGRVEKIEANADGNKGIYRSTLFTDYAIDFIERHKDSDNPFALFLCHIDPHSPLQAPDHAIFGEEDWSDDAKTYASMVYQVDKSVGRIKQYLIAEDLAENTILMFTSDNGPRSNKEPEIDRVAKFFDSNGQLQGYKADVYEGGIRVPMVAWSPKLIKAASVNNTPYYFADVMLSFADIANFKLTKPTDGISFYPALRGDNELSKPRFLYWEFDYRGFNQAVRYGKWKAVLHDNNLELYDLSKDLAEENNIADEYPEMVSQMRAYLKDCRTESPYWPVSTK
jgi:arylsulfatase A-like enzyme